MRLNPIFRVAACSIMLAAFARSAAAQVAVVSNTVEEHVASSGQEYGGTIRLRNTSGQTQEVKLYVTDYAFHASGQTAYAPAGTTPRSNAAWITVQPTQVIVPPHGEAAVAYTVRVPAGTALSGTYWSMVMAETILKGSAQSSMNAAAPEHGQLGLRSVIRYGIQIATHMPETGARTVDVARTSVIEQGNGAKTLQFDVVNTGERAYRPKLSAEFYDENGTLAARFEKGRGLVYPGSSVQQQFELPALKRGTYKVLIVADTGGDKLFASQYRMSL